jgi:hypothetical protein
MVRIVRLLTMVMTIGRRRLVVNRMPARCDDVAWRIARLTHRADLAFATVRGQSRLSSIN